MKRSRTTMAAFLAAMLAAGGALALTGCDYGNNPTPKLSTDATLTSAELGGVTIPALGTPAATWDDGGIAAGTVTLSTAEAANAAFSAVAADANVQSIEYGYTASDTDPTGSLSATWTPATIGDQEYVWIKVTAEDAATVLIYKIQVTVSNGPPTADIAFQYLADGTAGGVQGTSAPGPVAINVDNGVSSVLITLTDTAAQTLAVTGTDAADVSYTDSGADTVLTVATSSVATAGGSKAFTLTVSEPGHTDIDYNVTVTVSGPAITSITATDITIATTAPARDAALATSHGVTSFAGFTVGAFAWDDTSAIGAFADSGNAAASTVYYSKYVLTAESTYTFGADGTFSGLSTPGGASAISGTVSGSGATLTIVVTWNATDAAAATPITPGNFNTIAAPVKYVAAASAGKASGTGYTVGATTWKVGPGFTTTLSGNFAAGTVYRADIALSAESGYTFTGLTAATAFDTVTGLGTTTAGDITLDIAAGGATATLQVTYPATASFELADVPQASAYSVAGTASVGNYQFHYAANVLTWQESGASTKRSATINAAGTTDETTIHTLMTTLDTGDSFGKGTGTAINGFEIYTAGATKTKIEALFPLSSPIGDTVKLRAASASLSGLAIPNGKALSVRANGILNISGAPITGATGTIITEGTGVINYNNGAGVNLSGLTVPAAKSVTDFLTAAAALQSAVTTLAGTPKTVTIASADGTTAVTVQGGGGALTLSSGTAITANDKALSGTSFNGKGPAKLTLDSSGTAVQIKADAAVTGDAASAPLAWTDVALTNNGVSYKAPTVSVDVTFTAALAYGLYIDSAASPTTAAGTTLASALTWIQGNAATGTIFHIKLDADESSAAVTLGSPLSGKTITLEGTGGPAKVITLTGGATAGSLFTVQSGVTLVLDNNITLAGQGTGVANNKALVTVAAGGTLVMHTGATITGNKSTGTLSGGVNTSGVFTMDGGTISGNTSGSSGGAGVYLSAGTFTMSGGTISGNTGGSGHLGGGVYVAAASFTMSGSAAITGNTADFCGGVNLQNNSASFTMNGGTISGNTSGDSSGGVSIQSGTFTMNSGTISGNTANGTGGGVYVGYSADAKFIMVGGSITTDNNATTGKTLWKGPNGVAKYTSAGGTDIFSVTGAVAYTSLLVDGLVTTSRAND